MPKQLGPIGDVILWATIKGRGLSCVHGEEPTVAYRSQYEGVHYRHAKRAAMAGAKSKREGTEAGACAWWKGLATVERERWENYFCGRQPY